MGPITVLLADDHHVVRHGLRTLLETQPDIRVVGEASDGLETVELVKSLEPNVLVLDLMMPGLHGLEVVRQTTGSSPATHVVILTMYSSEAYVVEALQAGAKGYVLKSATSDELMVAIREAAIGRRYVCSGVSEQAIETYTRRAEAIVLDKYEMLTTREREVLHLTAQGHTNAQIADRLNIGRRTVETHRANLMRKLGLRNQVDLARYALHRGILPPDT